MVNTMDARMSDTEMAESWKTKVSSTLPMTLLLSILGTELFDWLD